MAPKDPDIDPEGGSGGADLPFDETDNVDRELFRKFEKLRQLRIEHRDLDDVISRLRRLPELACTVECCRIPR